MVQPFPGPRRFFGLARWRQLVDSGEPSDFPADLLPLVPGLRISQKLRSIRVDLPHIVEIELRVFQYRLKIPQRIFGTLIRPGAYGLNKGLSLAEQISKVLPLVLVVHLFSKDVQKRFAEFL